MDSINYRFATTRWSVIRAADDHNDEAARQALTRLCRTYWHPIYAYIRRKGYSGHDTEDLTQEFFAFLFAKDFFNLADPNRGQFRSFLLTALENFLHKNHARANRLKRGGGYVHISLDGEAAEQHYSAELANGDEVSADQVFDRQWAIIVFENAMTRLAEEYRESGRQPLFDALQPFLLSENHAAVTDEVAERLDMTPGAVRVAIHRLRKRFRKFFCLEVAETLSDATELRAEVRYLIGMLKR